MLAPASQDCLAGGVLIHTKIQLLKRALGAQPEKLDDKGGNRKILRLKKNSAGDWEWDLDAWADGICSAVKDLGLPCDPNDVILPLTVKLGRVVFFRRYYHLCSSNRQMAQEHEAISKGYVLSFTTRIKENGTLPTPTIEQLHQIYSYVGEYEGISEWGRERGYGRFNVKELYPVGRSDFGPGELPQRVPEGAPVCGEEDADGGGESRGELPPTEEAEGDLQD